MTPFRTTKYMMIWLCLCPTTKSWNKEKKFLRVVFTLTILLLIACIIIAHLMYFSKFMSIDVSESLFALMNVIAISDTLYGLIVEFLLRDKIDDMFKEISIIYKASELTALAQFHSLILLWSFHWIFLDKHTDAYPFLVRANNISEWMWSLFFKCLKFIFYVSALVSILSVILSWLINGTFNADNLYRPLKIMWVTFIFHNYLQQPHVYLKNWQFTLESIDNFGLFRRNVFCTFDWTSSYDSTWCIYSYVHVNLHSSHDILRDVQPFDW